MIFLQRIGINLKNGQNDSEHHSRGCTPLTEKPLDRKFEITNLSGKRHHLCRWIVASFYLTPTYF